MSEERSMKNNKATIRNISGQINLPGDKSISHRAAFLGSLSSEGIRVENFSGGADCAATLKCLSDVGCIVEKKHEAVTIRKGSGFKDPERVLDACNSGTTARLLTGLLAGKDGIFAVLSGDASLRRRPMARIVKPLQAMGARIDGRGGAEKLPLAIKGVRLSGGVHTPEVPSAQVKTALLLAGLSASESTTVAECGVTRDHTEIMLDFLGIPHERNGKAVTVYPCTEVPGATWKIPGDFSAASFWIVGAALASVDGLDIKDTGINPTRTGVLGVLERMGLSPVLSNRRKWGKEPVADISVKKTSLRATEITRDEIPSMVDELPIVALAATQAQGTTVISGAGELRFKECDRIHAVAEGLTTLGADIEERPDGWIIRGPSELNGGKVRTFEDHRIVMTFAIASLIAGGEVVLDDTTPVSISDPGFFSNLEKVGQGVVQI
jgi:3-phosphoshikimate 1-carboxyvinyltransferase